MDILNLNFEDRLVFQEGGKCKFKVSLLVNKENKDEYAFGVDAPRHVSVDREEVWLRKEKVKQRTKSKDS